MRAIKLCAVFHILLFGVIAAGCAKKKTEPAPAPTAIQAPEGERAQAYGTADMAKAPETQAETQAETAPASDCTYSTDPKGIAVQWTAFKFTEKTPVKGSFTVVNVQGPNAAKSLAALAEGLRMDIDGASIESGDPGRNVTVKDFFFGKLNPPFKLQAIAKKLNGSDTQGNLMIEINMNGVVKEVPFAYSANEQGEMAAKGGINLMDWQLQGAFDSLHKACEQLHTGKDGISKTWDVVDLEIKGRFTKACGPAAAPPAQNLQGP